MPVSRANLADIFAEEEMANKETESTMNEFATNDKANYYSGITSITVNGKNAYELKGNFLDDLHNNAFSGAYGVVVFLILLAGNAMKWFDEIKGSITSWVDLTANFFRKYYPPSRTGGITTTMIKWDPTNPKFEYCDDTELTNEKGSDLEDECSSDVDETVEIFKIEDSLLNYETPLYIDGFFNGGELPGMVRVGCMTYFQDHKWYDELTNGKLKEEALTHKIN
ncbi:hypothetical protein Tco_0089033 [Tanacetum coccineum]